MGLSNENKDYLDGFGRGSRYKDNFVDSLKEVLTNTNVSALKTAMKTLEIADLNIKKVAIETKLTELSKG